MMATKEQQIPRRPEGGLLEMTAFGVDGGVTIVFVFMATRAYTKTKKWRGCLKGVMNVRRVDYLASWGLDESKGPRGLRSRPAKGAGRGPELQIRACGRHRLQV